MSLNGLDDVKVKEAHDVAVAEPGGWFLLKYASRDEIELLGRGNGGIVEIRNSIAKFEEESPLFGFLRYRRRNVLIKYVPESCSRLVQARATVHFNAITERFTPYDTTFPIATSKELKDSTLSAACSLHTASGSTSSSTSSLRRRRLMEIAEDEEEDKRQSMVAEERPETAKDVSAGDSQAPDSTPHSDDPTSKNNLLSPPSTSTPSHHSDEHLKPPGSPDARRPSTQSVRPDFYTYNSYSSTGRPKVKLGPRPSLDIGGRPHTSASSGAYRPISTLPANLKLFSRSSKKPRDRPQSQHPGESPSMTLTPHIPQNSNALAPPEMAVRPHTSGGRPNTSSGVSVKISAPTNSPAPKVPTITPEKARLMKALEMRKKQKSQPPKSDHLSADSNEVPKSPSIAERPVSTGPPPEADDSGISLNDMAKADSGISIEAPSVLKMSGSDFTRSSSTPGSPLEPSEGAHSTEASSISDSTGETVHETSVVKESGLEDKEAQHDDEKLVEAVPQVETLPVVPEESPQVEISANEAFMEPPLMVEDKIDDIAIVEPEQPINETSDQTLEEDHAEELPKPAVIDVVPSIENAVEEVDIPEEKNVPEAHEPQVDPRLSAFGVKEPEEESTISHEPGTEPEVEPEAPKPAPKELKIPRSKFSVQDLKQEAAKPEEPPLPALPVLQNANINVPKSPVDSSFSHTSKLSFTEDEHDATPETQKERRRRAIMEPIRTDIGADRSAATSEVDFASDDDLMDELQSATVLEAKPIMVAKSPITPLFSSPEKEQTKEKNRFSRAFSHTLKSTNDKLMPPAKPEPTRSVSAAAAYLNRVSQQPAPPLAKKVNLGSGISQRIKALEKLSSSATNSVSGQKLTAPVPTPTFFSVRKPGSAGGSRSPSIQERANSLTGNRSSPSGSRESSPETFKLRDRSGSIQSRREVFGGAANQAHHSRPESISVTAKIIRDPAQPFPSKPEIGKDRVDFTPLDLKQSPLVIDHQKAIPPVPPKDTIQERRLSNPSKTSKEIKRERRSSITIVKDLINDTRNSFAERRKSMTIESPNRTPTVSPSRPPSTHTNSSFIIRPMSNSSRRSSREYTRSPGSISLGALSPSTSEENLDKKPGRASRMMRRMSSSLSAGRKSLAHMLSPTVREETEPLATDPPSSSQDSTTPPSTTTTIAEIGDINVQFPDTLLWKRRYMRVDSHGFLILSQAQGTKSNEKSAGIKKYHLSDFKVPFIPEMEAQELPNSVVLDFIQGSGLQVACEDRGGQLRILHLLQEAHSSWALDGQP